MKITIFPSDKATQRRIIQQVQSRLSSLSPGNVYTLEAILGADYWISTEDPHQGIGIRFGDLVSQGRLPFERAGWTAQRANRYRFTG
jgi:hypothetical protein